MTIHYTVKSYALLRYIRKYNALERCEWCYIVIRIICTPTTFDARRIFGMRVIERGLRGKHTRYSDIPPDRNSLVWLPTNLPPEWWERVIKDAEFLLNRMPHASSSMAMPLDGDVASPLEHFTAGSYSRKQVRRELDYYVATGTPCLVHCTNALGSTLGPKVRWGIACGMLRESVQFVCPFTKSTFRSKSFNAYKLQSGMNYAQFLGLKSLLSTKKALMLPEDKLHDVKIICKLPDMNEAHTATPDFHVYEPSAPEVQDDESDGTNEGSKPQPDLDEPQEAEPQEADYEIRNLDTEGVAINAPSVKDKRPTWAAPDAETHDFSQGPLMQTHDGRVLTIKDDGTLCTPDGKVYPPQEEEAPQEEEDTEYKSSDDEPEVVVTTELNPDDADAWSTGVDVVLTDDNAQWDVFEAQEAVGEGRGVTSRESAQGSKESFERICKRMNPPISPEHMPLYRDWLINHSPACDSFSEEMIPTARGAIVDGGIDFPYPTGHNWRVIDTSDVVIDALHRQLFCLWLVSNLLQRVEGVW